MEAQFAGRCLRMDSSRDLPVDDVLARKLVMLLQFSNCLTLHVLTPNPRRGGDNAADAAALAAAAVSN